MGTFVLSAVIVLVQHASACKLVIGLLHLSFILIVGPLSAKIVYIWYISFLKRQQFEGYNKMNLKTMTIAFVILPLILCSIYFIVWIVKT